MMPLDESIEVMETLDEVRRQSRLTYRFESGSGPDSLPTGVASGALRQSLAVVPRPHETGHPGA